MADDADRAAQAVEFTTAAALQRHRSNTAATAPSDGICCDCRLEIEPERLAAIPEADRRTINGRD